MQFTPQKANARVQISHLFAGHGDKQTYLLTQALNTDSGTGGAPDT